MNISTDKTLRLIFPQWQGGNNPAYQFGAQLLSWLAPEASGPVAEVNVASPLSAPLENEGGIIGRAALRAQLASAQQLLQSHNPDAVVVLGGDCLVSLAPFAWLSEKYRDKLGVLWIDTHPDVMTPEQFENAHAHVLGALMGNGDPDLTGAVTLPLSAEKIMIAGIHHPSAYEADFIRQHGINTCSPAEVKSGAEAVISWMESQNIEYLAIHLDLDVLDPAAFRSVLFARPGRNDNDFGGAAEGKLLISDVLSLTTQVAKKSPVVGLTIAEHLPWDAANLKSMLSQLPLLGTGAKQ